MNKILLTLLILVSAVSFAQKKTYVLDFGTLANSVTETQYVDLSSWRVIDSISVALAGTGEVDVDSVDIYLGYKDADGGWYGSTAYTHTSTLDLAAGVKSWVLLTVTNATKLTKAVMRGVTSLKVTTRGSTSGNDATDPNRLKVIFYVWGTP